MVIVLARSTHKFHQYDLAEPSPDIDDLLEEMIRPNLDPLG